MPSAIATATPSTQPTIACGPPIAARNGGIVMNGPTPTIIPMFRLTASSSESLRLGIARPPPGQLARGLAIIRMPSRARKRLPPASLNDREEPDGLRAAIAHFKASPGPVVVHPLLGQLPREEWDRFHCHHCAHHPSFANPAEGDGAGRARGSRRGRSSTLTRRTCGAG